MSARQAVDALRRAVEQLRVAQAALADSPPSRAPGQVVSEREQLDNIVGEVERIAERAAERAQREALR